MRPSATAATRNFPDGSASNGDGNVNGLTPLTVPAGAAPGTRCHILYQFP